MSAMRRCQWQKLKSSKQFVTTAIWFAIAVALNVNRSSKEINFTTLKLFNFYIWFLHSLWFSFEKRERNKVAKAAFNFSKEFQDEWMHQSQFSGHISVRVSCFAFTWNVDERPCMYNQHSLVKQTAISSSTPSSLSILISFPLEFDTVSQLIHSIRYEKC